MKENTRRIENLKITQEIFGDNYEKFINIISNNQEEISKISTTPIDNYINNAIDYENKELLRYIYQNVKYYLNKNMIYTSKIEEGMAIVISKAAILNSTNASSLRNYFSRGDFSINRELCNPFEEISRMLLCSIKNESVINMSSNVTAQSCDKLKSEDRNIMSVLNSAVTKNGVANRIMAYGCGDVYNNLCADLEFSSVTSENVRSATVKENREVLLNQFDRIRDLYCVKIDYDRMITGFPTEASCNRLKTRFEDKIVYTKRNIGVYEKTKRLVKKGQY